MVDLPSQPDRLVTTEAPQPRISSSEVANSGEQIARGLSKVGQGLEDVGVPIAEEAGTQAGQQAVTRNADGSLNVTNPASSFIFNPRMAAAFQKSANDAVMPALRTQIDQDLNKSRQDYGDNPPELLKQNGIYADGLKAHFPGAIGQEAWNYAQQVGSQHYDGAVNEVANTQAAATVSAQKNRRDYLENQAEILASQPGGVNSLQYAKIVQEHSQIGDDLASNTLSGYSKDQKALDEKQFDARMKGAQVDATIDDLFKQPDGRTKALNALNTGILNNPDLSATDRAQLYSRGMARLSVLTGIQSATVEANRPFVSDAVASLNSGDISPESPIIQGLVDHSKAVGDTQGVAAIEAAREVRRKNAGMQGLSTNGTLQAYGMPSANYGGYFGALAQQENASGSNTASPGTSSALGKFQFTADTWAAVSQAHPELGLTADGRTDPAQQDKAVTAFTADNRAALQRAGIEPNDKNAYLAHFMGAGGAIKFIRAAQANPNASAAALFPAEADANQPVFYDRKTMQARTLAEVYNLQTAKFSGASTIGAPSANGIPFTAAQVAANPLLGSAYLRQAASDPTARVAATRTLLAAVNRSIDGGIAPAPENVAQVYQMGAQYPQQLGAEASALRARIEGGNAADAAASTMSGAGAAAYGAQINSLAQGADIYHGQLAMAYQQRLAFRNANLKTDPAGEALARGWTKNLPAPMDPANPQSWGPAIAQRGLVASAISSHEGGVPQGVFSDKEAPIPASVIANGTVEQKMALLAPLSQLPAPIRNATFQQLGVKDAASQAFAAASDLTAKGHPEVAQAILAGQQLLQNEPRLAPKDTDQQTNFAKSFPFNDFPNADLRATVLTSATAYYAKLSAASGDVSQNFNQGRWDQALGAVTGGIVNYRGSNVIAPAYNMTGGQFGQLMNTLTDKDLAGSRTRDGTPLPAAALKPSFAGGFTGGVYRMQSLADGKYVVFSGDDQARSLLRNATNDQPFVLDLSGKIAPEAMPAYMPPPAMAQFPDMSPLGRARDRVAPIQLPTPGGAGGLLLPGGLGDFSSGVTRFDTNPKIED